MLIEKTPRRLFRLQVILWLGLLLLGTFTAKTQALEAKNVLVIYSAGRLLPGNIEFDRAFHQSLQATYPDVRIYDEFLDVSRFPEAGQTHIFATYLREKYASQRPDVIVTAADMALRFTLENRQQLFPQAPVVYAGVLQSSLPALGELPADVIGVYGEIDFAATIEQALRWHPQTRRLVLVTGTSGWDNVWEAKLRQLVPGLPKDVAVDFLSGLPLAQLQQKLGTLSPDTLVFSPGFFRDADGRDFIPHDASQLIGDASAAPFYGPFPTHIGTGIIGGYMLSWTAQAQQTSNVVNQLLTGTAPTALGLPEKLQTIMHIDWNQAQRWGIDEDQLPSGTIVHFREPGLLEEYGKEVLGIVLLILLQAALIGLLLFERRRRRLAEQAIYVKTFELAHASRLAIAGQLTGSIAHEINQPLAAILSNADTAGLLLDSGGEHTQELQQILADIRQDDLRASQVIRRLRALLEKNEQERLPVDLNDTLKDVSMLLRTEALRCKVSLDFYAADRPLRVLGDRIQLQQVVINLLLNAMDAVADNPEDQRRIDIFLSPKQDAVCISVHDHGHGIAAEHLPQIFDSFFSRKPGGMGLGLSIVRTIVEAHGGQVHAQSSLGAGTQFRVELPLLPEENQ